MTQPTIYDALVTACKPSARAVYAVLADGAEHSATEFWRGVHGFTLNAVSQRVGELRRAGIPVENAKRDGGVAVYQLTR